jgi:hypothetical protein
MSEMAVSRLIPGSETLVWEWQPGSAGFFLGTPLEVPPGHTAVVVLRGEPLDFFLPGSHMLDVQHLPLLCQRTRLGDGRQAVPAHIYMVRMPGTHTVSWSADVILAEGRSTGLVGCRLGGSAAFRVHDARRFLQCLWQAAVTPREGDGHQSFRLTTGAKRNHPQVTAAVAAEAEVHVAEAVGDIAAHALAGRPVESLFAPGALEALRPDLERAIAEGMLEIGIVSLDTRIAEISRPELVPCGCCGRADRKRAYAIFRYTISLFYVRFGGHRAGNFCLLCGLQYGLGYTLLILFMGWWGIIGLFLSPVYLVMNLYNLGGLLFTQKSGPPEIG